MLRMPFGKRDGRTYGRTRSCVHACINASNPIQCHANAPWDCATDLLDEEEVVHGMHPFIYPSFQCHANGSIEAATDLLLPLQLDEEEVVHGVDGRVIRLQHGLVRVAEDRRAFGGRGVGWRMDGG